jgi:hypothetical protein
MLRSVVTGAGRTKSTGYTALRSTDEAQSEQRFNSVSLSLHASTAPLSLGP